MLRRMTLAVGIVLLIAALPIFAQTKVRAEVPFDFSLGGKILPAGTYTVTHDISNQGMLKIRSRDGRNSAVTLGTAIVRDDSEANYSLVFNRYENKFFLTMAWMGSVARRVPASRAEQEMVARLGEPETITVLARVR